MESDSMLRSNESEAKLLAPDSPVSPVHQTETVLLSPTSPVPQSRPRTVTCISAPGDSSPSHTSREEYVRPRSKSVRIKNQVDLHKVSN